MVVFFSMFGAPWAALFLAGLTVTFLVGVPQSMSVLFAAASVSRLDRRSLALAHPADRVFDLLESTPHTQKTHHFHRHQHGVGNRRDNDLEHSKVQHKQHPNFISEPLFAGESDSRKLSTEIKEGSFFNGAKKNYMKKHPQERNENENGVQLLSKTAKPLKTVLSPLNNFENSQGSVIPIDAKSGSSASDTAELNEKTQNLSPEVGDNLSQGVETNSPPDTRPLGETEQLPSVDPYSATNHASEVPELSPLPIPKKQSTTHHRTDNQLLRALKHGQNPKTIATSKFPETEDTLKSINSETTSGTDSTSKSGSSITEVLSENQPGPSVPHQISKPVKKPKKGSRFKSFYSGFKNLFNRLSHPKNKSVSTAENPASQHTKNASPLESVSQGLPRGVLEDKTKPESLEPTTTTPRVSRKRRGIHRIYHSIANFFRNRKTTKKFPKEAPTSQVTSVFPKGSELTESPSETELTLGSVSTASGTPPTREKGIAATHGIYKTVKDFIFRRPSKDSKTASSPEFSKLVHTAQTTISSTASTSALDEGHKTNKEATSPALIQTEETIGSTFFNFLKKKKKQPSPDIEDNSSNLEKGRLNDNDEINSISSYKQPKKRTLQGKKPKKSKKFSSNTKRKFKLFHGGKEAASSYLAIGTHSDSGTAGFPPAPTEPDTIVQPNNNGSFLEETAQTAENGFWKSFPFVSRKNKKKTGSSDEENTSDDVDESDTSEDEHRNGEDTARSTESTDQHPKKRGKVTQLYQTLKNKIPFFRKRKNATSSFIAIRNHSDHGAEGFPPAPTEPDTIVQPNSDGSFLEETAQTAENGFWKSFPFVSRKNKKKTDSNDEENTSDDVDESDTSEDEHRNGEDTARSTESTDQHPKKRGKVTELYQKLKNKIPFFRKRKTATSSFIAIRNHSDHGAEGFPPAPTEPDTIVPPKSSGSFLEEKEENVQTSELAPLQTYHTRRRPKTKDSESVEINPHDFTLAPTPIASTSALLQETGLGRNDRAEADSPQISESHTRRDAIYTGNPITEQGNIAEAIGETSVTPSTTHPASVHASPSLIQMQAGTGATLLPQLLAGLQTIAQAASNKPMRPMTNAAGINTGMGVQQPFGAGAGMQQPFNPALAPAPVRPRFSGDIGSSSMSSFLTAVSVLCILKGHRVLVSA